MHRCFRAIVQLDDVGGASGREHLVETFKATGSELLVRPLNVIVLPCDGGEPAVFERTIPGPIEQQNLLWSHG